MPKKEEKQEKKPADEKTRQNRIKELEKMVEEERKKFLKKRKSTKKSPKSKKQKPEQELSDKVKQAKKRKWKKDIQAEIDYHHFLEQQARKLDYSAMFSYLGNLKKPEYEYSDGVPENIAILYKKNETISWEEIMHFTDEWKMDQIMNINRAFEASEQRTAYHWWKYLNPGLATLLYELSLT